MQLFYHPDIDEHTVDFRFEAEESRHIVKVLRKREGDTVAITNGKGMWFEGAITQAHQKHCEIEIVRRESRAPLPYKLHMAVAPTKSGDRFEWFLEKATEIGLSAITPLICEHSERRRVKTERLEKIVLSAMKQSQQCHLPKINPTVSFDTFMAQSHSGNCCIAHCMEGDKAPLFKSLTPAEPITILIGPEGDFSVKEVEKALEKGFKAITLGDHRLRTETAAIMACANVAIYHE